MAIVMLLVVLAFALPLVMVASPVSIYIVPAVLVGLGVSYLWRKRVAQR